MGDTATLDAGQQHLRAGASEPRTSSRGARLKRDVAAERISAAEVVLSCPWAAASSPSRPG